MVESAVPEAVAGEEYGRLGMSAIQHGLDPSISTAGKIGFALALITVVIVLIDLILRGRMRRTSLALTQLLTFLAPVAMVFAVSAATIHQWLALPTDSGPLPTFVVIQAAVAFLYGSLFSGVGIVLTFLLKLDDAWRGRKVVTSEATSP